MQIYSTDVQIEENTDLLIKFNFMNETKFIIDMSLVKYESPFSIGSNFDVDDQLLFKKELSSDLIIAYIKDKKVLVTRVNDTIPNMYFKTTETSYTMVFEYFSDLLSFKQTGETTFTVFDRKNTSFFSIHDMVTFDRSVYVYPIDLGLTTVEFRYLTIGKVTYESYILFIMYDLFRREIFTKKVLFTVLSNDGEMIYKLINPYSIEILKDNSIEILDLKKISPKGNRVFDVYQNKKLRHLHILGIVKINGIKYFLHNRLTGVFFTRANPMSISGFYPNMKSRFIGNNLYILGRSTHYAFNANGKYDYLYSGSNDKPIALFKRPFKFRLLRRYGYFKVPIQSLTANIEGSNLYLGSKKAILHPLKLKLRPKKNNVLDFKIKKEQVHVLRTNSKGHVLFLLTPKTDEYLFFKRKFIYLKNLKKSPFALKVFRLIFKVMGRLPKKNKLVIFESFHAKQYSDNPRAIYEYMKEHSTEYKLLWSIDKQAVKLFEDFKVPYMTRFSLKWFLTFPRAKYWVNNVRLPGWMPKPRGTTYVQTWHGTPLKRLGLDIEEIHMPGTKTETYKRNFINESQNWDYLVSPNSYSTEIFKRAFHYEGTVIESGYPRNDVLSSPSDGDIKRLKEKLGIPLEKKVMLYAPTWRDNEFYQKGKYKFTFKFDLEKWKSQFGEEWVLLSRMHYLVAENFDFSEYEGTVYDVSTYPDIRDLYLVSDLLITDYSSVFFDYAILNRPIIFFMYDLEIYRDQLRGFYIDIEQDAPGPIVQTEEELFQSIRELIGSSVSLNPEFATFKDKFASLENGHATKRVVQAFLKSSDKK